MTGLDGTKAIAPTQHRSVRSTLSAEYSTLRRQNQWIGPFWYFSMVHLAVLPYGVLVSRGSMLQCMTPRIA